ncbi:MAG: Gfo/Idh/MocA family oxidoreductase [Hyphomicrobiaceae bacterium]|nr:Gfo/Idh/MocA family oxidoreductase [Hyphomicrobiaceae bacterium]
MPTRKTFALLGVAGYIAHRHLTAIRDVGGELVAAMDTSDSVGQIDAHFPMARFFTRFEQFESYLQALKRNGTPVDFVSVCTPNDLHRAHIEAGLRCGANVICEKPLVLTPSDIDALIALERDLDRCVYTILQLRLVPENLALRDEFAIPCAQKPLVDLTYVTARGQWYFNSWKGDDRRSGGIATNIGVHFFDLLGFLFGKLETNVVHHRAVDCAAGYLGYERARVRWFLSINARDMPQPADNEVACRRMTIGSRICNLSGDFRALHTLSYQNFMDGRRVPLDDVRRAISTVTDIRNAPINTAVGDPHPYLARILNDQHRYRDGFPA